MQNPTTPYVSRYGNKSFMELLGAAMAVPTGGNMGQAGVQILDQASQINAPAVGSLAAGTVATQLSELASEKMLLRDWRAAVAGLQYTGSGNPTIVWIGDSWTGSQYICAAVRAAIQSAYGNAGVGFVGVDDASGVAPFVPAVTRTKTGTWADSNLQSTSLGLNAAHTTGATSASLAMAATATDFVVHFAKVSGGGMFSVTWDKVTNNFLSPQTLTATWIPSQATITTSADPGPFGCGNAFQLTEDSTTNLHRLCQNVTRVAGTYKIAVYAKAAGRDRLCIIDSSGGYLRSHFNLATGTVIPGPEMVSTITPKGNGWYLCTAETVSATGSQQTSFETESADYTDSYAGNGSGAILLSAPQLVQGTVIHDLAFVNTANATTAYGTCRLSGASNANHTLTIDVLSGPVTLLGVEANIATPGARLHTIPAPGARSEQFAAVNAAMWTAGIAALAPDLVVLSLGVTEKEVNYPPTSQAADYATLAGRIYSAMPNADVLLVTEAETGTTCTYTIADYRNAQRNLAMAQGWDFLDGVKLLGPYAASSARGLWSNTTHVNYNGGRIIANELITRLGL